MCYLAALNRYRLKLIEGLIESSVTRHTGLGSTFVTYGPKVSVGDANPPSRATSLGYAGRVVFLDLEVKGSKVSGKAERIRPGPQGDAPEKLFVSWNASKCPTGFEDLGSGVAFVQRPATYYLRERLEADTDDVAISDTDKRHGVKRFSWGEGAGGDVLMFVLLPPNYRLMDCSPDAASPSPFVTKVVKKRMVLICALPGSNARMTCAMEPLRTASVVGCSGEVNRELSLRNKPFEPIDGIEVNAAPAIIPAKPGPERVTGFPILAAIYYPLLFVLIVSVLAAVFSFAPWYTAPLIVAGGILAYSVVGAFVIRQQEPLSNESFVKLMGAVLKALPIIRRLQKP